jgi:hypothetical protein
MKCSIKMTALAAAFALSACSGGGQAFPSLTKDGALYGAAPVVVRQPVVPEMLVNCDGHVLVPALGMIFVPRGKEPPATGQYLREERLSPPYRIIPPSVRLSVEQSPSRVNIELDNSDRITGLFCG